jgi:glycosyltransferase involved in cell wall biosynthesis
MNGPWVVAVRAAMPSPRPQAWQALQQAVGLAGTRTVHLVADAALADGGPASAEDWLGRRLPPTLHVVVPGRNHRPPLAGVLFRRSLARLRDRRTTLLCRDPRVAAAEGERRRWKFVVHEWHVPPQPHDRVHAAALERVDLHVAPSPGIVDDLRSAGVPAARVLLLANACGLDRARARRRRPSEGDFVVSVGLHRRSGLDTALDAWRSDPDLPPLVIAGRDQGGDRVDAWQAGPQNRVRFVGPVWNHAREDLLDRACVWLAAYPEDSMTRTRLCPLQVADALGSGLPVVAPDLPSIRALAGEPCPTGLFLYRPGDPASLAATVKRARRRPAGFPGRPDWTDRGRSLAEALS